MYFRAALLSLTVFVAGSAASTASAEPRDAAAAEVLFHDAREAMKANQYALACSKFEESQRLDPAPGTLLNLAECEEKRGRLATAWQYLKHALDSLPANDDRI